MKKPFTLFTAAMASLVIVVACTSEPQSATATAKRSFTMGDPVSTGKLKQEIRGLLDKGDFAKLERMADEFRINRSRFPEGVFKLHYFYRGVTEPKKETDQEYRRVLDLMGRWAEEYPDSITARVALGGTWMEYGWFARGTGYANTVTDKGWRLFYERLDKAHALLFPPPKSGDDCPGRYNFLLIVSSVRNYDRKAFDAIFNEAVAFDPLYFDFYVQKANTLMTRWHGTEGEWQRFADEAAETVPGPEGSMIYTRILWNNWNKSDWKTFCDPGISWDKLRLGFKEMERRFPDSRWNLNNFALFCVIANDMDTARALFEKMGDDPIVEIWGSTEYYELCRKAASNGN